MNQNPIDPDDTRDRFYCANCGVTFVQPPVIQQFYDIADCPGCDWTALNIIEIERLRNERPSTLATMDDLFE